MILKSDIESFTEVDEGNVGRQDQSQPDQSQPDLRPLYVDLHREATSLAAEARQETIGITVLNQRSPAFRKIRRLTRFGSEEVLARSPVPLPVENLYTKVNSLESYIDTVAELCTKSNVTTITNAWIEFHVPALATCVRTRVHQGRARSTIELWDQIRTLCQGRGIIIDNNAEVAWEGQTLEGLEKETALLIELLKRENPPEWSQAFMHAHMLNEYKRLSRALRCGTGLRWKLLIDRLPSDLAERFCLDAPKGKEKHFEAFPDEKELYIRGQSRSVQNKLAEQLIKRFGDQGEVPITPQVIETLDGTGTLHAAIKRLRQMDPTFNWFDFMGGVPGNWVAHFDAPAYTVHDCIRKLTWKLRSGALHTWNISSLIQRDSFFYRTVRKRLRREQMSWNDFCATLPDEVLDRYDPEGENVRINVDSIRITSRSLARRIAADLRSSGVEVEGVNWTGSDIADKELRELFMHYVTNARESVLVSLLPEAVASRYKKELMPRDASSMTGLLREMSQEFSERKNAQQVIVGVTFHLERNLIRTPLNGGITKEIQRVQPLLEMLQAKRNQDERNIVIDADDIHRLHPDAGRIPHIAAARNQRILEVLDEFYDTLVSAGQFIGDLNLTIHTLHGTFTFNSIEAYADAARESLEE